MVGIAISRFARGAALAAVVAFSLAFGAAGTASGATAAPGAKAPSGSIVDQAMARDHRVALVIGNAHYTSSPLVNPVNDARAMSAALTTMGFTVMLVEDTSVTQLADAVRRFGEALKPGGVGLFFYAGHGMQIKGRNYLIPVGADIQREDEVAFNAFETSQVLEKMEGAKSRVNIVILDACRNNPFTRSFRSSTQGLATMDAPFGSYVAMATAPGRVANDGSEGNGVYTKNLLAMMKTPGLTIEEVFKRTRVQVMSATDSQQVPWDYSSLSGNFYFIPTESVAADMVRMPDTAPVASAASATSAISAKAALGSQSSTPGSTLARVSGSSGGASMKLASAAPSGAGRPDGPSAPPRGDRDFDPSAKGAESTQSASAAYDLGIQYKVGRKPMQQDLPRALKLFLEAAKKNHPAAQYEAARAYAQGLGTDKNCKEAIGWAQKAARAGSIEGAVLAGDLNRADCGGSRNLSESARWYKLAADKGMPAAQFALGVFYMNGEGVSKDLSEARKLLTAAAGQGNSSARFYLERLSK